MKEQFQPINDELPEELPIDKKSVDIRKILMLLRARGYPVKDEYPYLDKEPEEAETIDY